MVQVRTRGEFRIGFAEFWDGISRMATDRQEDKYVLVSTIVRTERPLVTVARTPPTRTQITAMNREREKRCADVFKHYDTYALDLHSAQCKPYSCLSLALGLLCSIASLLLNLLEHLKLEKISS